MPTVNKSMTLTPTNVVTGGGVGNSSPFGGGVGGSTSPKATLRKVVNHNTANVALFETNPTPTTTPAPCPPPPNGVAGVYAYGDNSTFARDPYSSFRSRGDPYGGSIRSHASFAHGSAPPLDNFGTLRSTKTNNLGDGYGTTRSVKKVYL